ARMADRVAESFREPFDLDGRRQAMAFSMGIALFPDDGADLQALLRNADLALYRAKEYGRNSYRFFTEDLNVQAFERRLLETSLQRALERDEFLLHYQPVVEMAGGRVTGFEALLQWRHPEVGLLPPSRFISVAEASGLIVPLGTRVLRAACRQAAAWCSASPHKPVVTVNISPRQLADPEIVQQVREAVAGSGLHPELLELDVTEEAVMRDPAEAEDTLRELRKIGVRVAVDDFGTGRSSLALLRRLPVDALKIDRALVRDVASSPDAASIVRAILGLARSFNLRAAAEGVETTAQRDVLLGGGCDLAQGYLYAAALSAADASKALEKGTLGPS
ncbi:MAG TPA: GGDEF domain-containing phosphodiesterase, partial [Burkholderiales bacterium]|nr:GGDEF domain-containing phosphodiesterase [Burkholderiales bacterium]